MLSPLGDFTSPVRRRLRIAYLYTDRFLWRATRFGLPFWAATGAVAVFAWWVS